MLGALFLFRLRFRSSILSNERQWVIAGLGASHSFLDPKRLASPNCALCHCCGIPAPGFAFLAEPTPSRSCPRIVGKLRSRARLQKPSEFHIRCIHAQKRLAPDPIARSMMCSEQRRKVGYQSKRHYKGYCCQLQTPCDRNFSHADLPVSVELSALHSNGCRGSSSGRFATSTTDR